jgi:acyl-CoA reductase-like NAD-dependent aldehyde dehydrogenase
MKVDKTIKLFIGGKFPRTESLRSFKVVAPRTGRVVANVGLASRKDVRMAVEAARAGLKVWSGRAAYNRAHILYRMAEMAEAKHAELAGLLAESLGLTTAAARDQVDRALQALVYYSGFCDKLVQVSGSINPVNAPYSNASAPEAMGVTVLLHEHPFDLGRLMAHLAAILAGGNSAVVLLDRAGCPALLSSLAEVVATSDVPGGVVNLLSGDIAELVPVFASHMDVRAISVQRDDPALLARVRQLAVENLKRVIPPRRGVLGLQPILDTMEIKTIWQPVGF